MKKLVLLLAILLVVPGVVSAIPNPAAVYCIEQGYEFEIRTGPDGGQYGVCIFPDGSECGEWQYYCKCEPNGITCWPGDFNCDFPCGELACREAGEFVSISKCCEGLTQIPRIEAYDDECNLVGYFGWVYICSDCGNGICESWESICNCPEDCARIRNITQNTYYQRIQDAINDANDGDTIIVTDGVYTGHGNRDIDFLGKAVTVRSENGPNNCIIDCESRGRGFCFYSQEDENSVLSGFTIISGSVGRGGAICCEESSPVISNCIISNCNAQYGGGIKLGRNSNATIINCIISGNSTRARGQGGGIQSNRSNPMIINCKISENLTKGAGGGIYCWGCNPIIRKCEIRGNTAERSTDQYWGSGGGIYCYKSNPLISSCLIIENSAEKGEGLVSCGGAIKCSTSSPTITNCTFSKNSADGLGGGIYSNSSSSPTLTNSIVWNNSDAGGVDESAQVHGGTPVVNYGCIQGWTGSIAGIGNINADPCFADPYNGDYHLLHESSCIDAGDPDYVIGPNETDLDGLPRVIGGRIDMGAYEFNHQPIAVAGPNQIAYAFIDGYADVNLDGSGSYDDDDDPLDYYWSWTIDGNTFTSEGTDGIVNMLDFAAFAKQWPQSENPFTDLSILTKAWLSTPASPNWNRQCDLDLASAGAVLTIELPIGEHTIELIVNDGIVDSEPDYVDVNVIAPLQARLFCIPRTLNRKTCYRGRVLALISMPPGVRKADIDLTEPLIFYPGQIESQRQFAFEFSWHSQTHTYVWAWFDKSECIEHLEPGFNRVNVVGKLTSGRYYDAAGYLRLVPVKWHH